MLYNLRHLNWVLSIVGNGPPEYLDPCMDLVETLKMQDKVQFIAKMKQHQLSKFFKLQDMIISNSDQEGQHAVIKEAMATGIYPFINCWLGADKTYPEKYIFKSPIQFQNKFKAWIKADNKLKLSKEASRFIHETYDATKQAALVRKEIERIAAHAIKKRMQELLL